MPERVYQNFLLGQRRIHVEITEAEIPLLLDDPTGPTAQQLRDLLADARQRFQLEDARTDQETA